MRREPPQLATPELSDIGAYNGRGLDSGRDNPVAGGVIGGAEVLPVTRLPALACPPRGRPRSMRDKAPAVGPCAPCHSPVISCYQ